MSHSHGHSHDLTADASVRPSVDEDAPLLGRIQAAAWLADGRVPASAEELVDAAAFSSAWAAAIASPPSAKHRMLTACEGATVVGFAALAPADEETGEIVALEVDPDHARAGHGSRLLAACADILRQTGATGLRTWIPVGNEGRIGFFTAAGFGPTGTRRTFDAGGTEVAQEAYGAQLGD
ncbi:MULTISPECIES: GNAT family N-acetyltransferase [unclassified Pseudactinotalea]|uniref:GNAT family N-acetyltransferase n=1 Tax=unclassified Pseudactinotalea TaxID=2649176 RepID=UPI00128D8B9A|nr:MULTISPECIES: GNAT family N-acetyltransferase [unclassified Pseudactinotalea]MPV49567.1 GNAT family N-acetyltransferase [Pseudactinotalea sp. HY160]QGH69869.1 GNAT family N-acetyltransferase [Pseudactinotalea sp. HY158]